MALLEVLRRGGRTVRWVAHGGTFFASHSVVAATEELEL